MRRIVMVLALMPSFAFAQHRAAPKPIAEPVGAILNEMSHAVFPLACSDAPQLYCNTIHSGTLGGCFSSPYYFDFYTFGGTAGTTLTIDGSTSTPNQILVTVQSYSDGTVLASNYGVIAHTVYTFPTTANYVIGVGFVAQFAAGPYALRLTCQSAAPPPSNQCVDSGTIGLNGSSTSTLSQANGTACLGVTWTYSQRFSFPATKDVPLSVSLASAFAGYLDVERTDGNFGLWRGGDGPGTLTILYVPEYTGTHRIYVGSWTTSPSTGAFTVHVDAVQPDQPCRRRAITH